jgi:diguanylate cyclase (GGDEF)-like protein/PAS domain S-box-containing protein
MVPLINSISRDEELLDGRTALAALRALDDQQADVIVGHAGMSYVRSKDDYDRERRNAQLLDESDQHFRLALASSQVVLSEQDLDLRYTWIHDPKPGPEASALLGKTDAESMEPACAAIIEALKREVIASGIAVRREVAMAAPGTAHADYAYHELTVEPRRNVEGQIVGVLCAATDVSERKRAEELVRKQKEFFHLIAENIGDFIAVVDTDGRRIYNSPSYTQFFGSERDLRGSDAFAELHPDDKARVQEVFRDTVRTGIGRRIQYRMLMADGTAREMESAGNVIRDSQGQITHVVVVARDVTERHQLEAQMRQLAFHDALTQLPNRRLLGDRLQQTMAASARSSSHAALLFLDLDNFKLLNDTHGHQFGDLLLIEAATRLKTCVRETDTVARFGGDEYVVVISELDAAYAESRSLAEAVAEKIRSALAQPFLLQIESRDAAPVAIEHQCTASIGIVLFIAHQASPDDILKWADAAMYQAKAAGRNMIRFHDAK